MLQRLAAFLKGVREFRDAFTTHYDDLALADTYDAGREFAHRLTLRHFDN